MDISGTQSLQPPGMQEHLQNRFEKADTDQSGTLTLDEMLNAAPENADPDKVAALFDKLDANGGGEITPQEHLELAESRREKFKERFSGDGSKLQDMLTSLTENENLSDEQKQQVNAALEQLNRGPTRESIGEALKLAASLMPSVTTQA